MLVEIPSEFKNTSHPLIFFRNESISISATVTPQCFEAYSLTFKWVLFTLDFNGTETEFSLTNNPSLNTLDLQISPNTLLYAIHKIELQANLTVDTGYIKNIKNVFSNISEAFIQIIPTGIEILTLENRLNYLKVGFNQSFELEPAKFSYDIDQVAKFEELKFEFFCFIKNQSENFTLLNLKNFNLTKNLFDYQINSNLSSECFTVTSKYFLKFFYLFDL